jgi:hypothetical protein
VEKLYDEDGNEIEFEGEVEEDLPDEEVVQKDEEDDEWEDED